MEDSVQPLSAQAFIGLPVLMFVISGLSFNDDYCFPCTLENKHVFEVSGYGQVLQALLYNYCCYPYPLDDEYDLGLGVLSFRSKHSVYLQEPHREETEMSEFEVPSPFC